MCLSKVYLKKIDPENLFMDEVSKIAEESGIISLNSLFGEEKKLEGFRIGEINLMNNYIILKSTGDNNNA
jgi:predicted RNA-binding protein